MMSLPSIATGMDLCWMGVGEVNFRVSKICNSRGAMPSPSKVRDGMGAFELVFDMSREYNSF